MTVLFWDIDGTLLTTGRAGIYAWQDAVRAVTGRELDLEQWKTAGLTDYQLAVLLLERVGAPAEAAVVDDLVRAYEDGLPANLPRRQGAVLANVHDILEAVRARDGELRSYLLTGNTRSGARAKLTHYGLAPYFSGGAFAEDAGDRASIARRALDLARRAGPLAEDRLFVIGDTPHDIDCANAIGARTLAVATGGTYSVAQLAAHGAWRAVAQLPPADEFFALLDGDTAAEGGPRS